MKIITRLLVFFLVINVFNSCTEEETNYALQDISAPSELKAIFDIAQDDSGEVSVTPTALGASVFRVFFGDVDNETPVEVAPGETITHVYGEGEFTLRIVAVGISGLTSELSRIVTISFAAPTDLELNIAVSETNPFEISVAPTATNATVFDIYYGDVENEEPTTIMAGETAVHVYAEVGDYTVRVVARGAGAATIELIEVVTISGASNPVELPITFEDPTVNYAVSGFGDVNFGPIPATVIDNPDATGINTSAKVLEINKLTDAQIWAGASIPLAGAIDFSGSTTVKIKVWSPRVDTPIRFKIEDSTSPADGNGNPTVFAEVEVNSTIASAWEELSFDMNNPVAGTFDTTISFDTAILFPDFGTAGQGELFYFDDIALASGGNCDAEAEENIDPALGDINWTFKTNDFDHSFEPFGDINSAIVNNPNPSGINTSCFVQSYVKTAGCQTWSGVGKALANAIDLTTSPNKVFTMKVLAESQVTEVTLRLEFEPFPNVDPAVDIVQTISEVGVWEELVFDFSAHSDKTFKSIIVYFDRDQPCDDAVYYFDDIKQVADAGGGGGTMPTTAAPDPTQAQADVINMYSNVYTQDVTVSSWRSDWSTSTLTDIQVAGNDTKEYIDADFVGVEFYDTPVDASGMDFFHVDVWTPNATTFRVKLVDLGAGSTEAEIAFDGIAQGQWVSLDIPMADFISGGMSATNSIQQLIFSGLPTAEFDFYIDNVYFYAGSGAVCDDAGVSGSGTTSFDVDFETMGTGGTSQWQVFENSDNPVLEVIANPGADGVNGSATVAKFTARAGVIAPCTNMSQPYAGVETPLTTPFTLDATNSTVKIMVWKSVISDVGIKFAVGAAAQPEIKVPNTVTNQWEELTFDFSSYIGLAEAINIDKLIIFPDFDARGQENIVYFDNITLSPSGGGSGSVPTSAAPDPTEAQADVINMYSNVYTQDVNVSSWRSDWSTSTLTDIQVAGNDTKEYIDADFVGVEFYAPDAVDASGMAFFHVDVWTPNATTFRVKLVDLGGTATEAEITFDGIAQGQWVSLDIPMADFISGGMTATNSIQQLIFSGLPTGTFDFYIDNVYFHN